MSEYPGCVTALHRLYHPAEKWPPGYFLDEDHGPLKIIPSHRVASGLGACDSNSSIFSLPVEVIDNIARCISSEASSSLSLVSRHCLQLARSLRFADVWLDYSPRSHAMLVQLTQEASLSREKKWVATLEFLGVCVRRLYVRTSVDHTEIRHRVDLRKHLPEEDEADDRHYLPRGEETRDPHEGNHAYYNDYLPAISGALMHALPNLEALQWEDRATHPRSCIMAMAHSPIKTLTLKYTQIVDDLTDAPISRPLFANMQLRYLSRFALPNDTAATLARNVMYLAAGTLEELRV